MMTQAKRDERRCNAIRVFEQDSDNRLHLIQERIQTWVGGGCCQASGAHQHHINVGEGVEVLTGYVRPYNRPAELK